VLTMRMMAAGLRRMSQDSARPSIKQIKAAHAIGL
jgi:hypothetical protein